MSQAFITATLAILMLSIANCAHHQHHQVIEGNQRQICSPNTHSGISIPTGSPYDILYKAIQINSERDDRIHSKKYLIPTFIIFSALSFITLGVLFVSFGVLCCSKICCCYGKVKVKAKRGVCEKTIESILLLSIILSSIAIVFYVLQVNKIRAFNKCAIKELENAWTNGDSYFEGFHALSSYLFTTISSLDYLENNKYNLRSLNNTLEEHTNNTIIELLNMSKIDDIQLQVPSPASRMLITPEYLKHLNPIDDANSITGWLADYISKVLSPFQNSSAELMSYYNYSGCMKDAISLTSIWFTIVGVDVFSSKNETTFKSSKDLDKPFMRDLKSQNKGHNKKEDQRIFKKLALETFVMLGIISLIAILHAISLFYAVKCIAILQLVLIAVLCVFIYCSGAISFIAGANISQTCNILTKATHQDFTSMDIVVGWVLTYDQPSNNSINLAKTCLFNLTSPSIMYYLTGGMTKIFYDVGYIAKMLDYFANQTISRYHQNDFYPSYMDQIYGELFTNGYNPINQSLPESTTSLEELNTLTENTDPECEIHDKWVYYFDDPTNSCGKYPQIYINSSFNDMYIGQNACLSLRMINETYFDMRYNQSFLEKCDPSGNIKSLYLPLFNYSNSTLNVFSMVRKYYNEFLYHWNTASRTASSIVNNAELITYFSQIAGISNINYTRNLGANEQCKGIQGNMHNVTYSHCRYGGAFSLMSFVLTLMGIGCIIYSLMRVNYGRYASYLKTHKEGNGKQGVQLLEKTSLSL